MAPALQLSWGCGCPLGPAGLQGLRGAVSGAGGNRHSQTPCRCGCPVLAPGRSALQTCGGREHPHPASCRPSRAPAPSSCGRRSPARGVHSPPGCTGRAACPRGRAYSSLWRPAAPSPPAPSHATAGARYTACGPTARRAPHLLPAELTADVHAVCVYSRVCARGIARDCSAGLPWLTKDTPRHSPPSHSQKGRRDATPRTAPWNRQPARGRMGGSVSWSPLLAQDARRRWGPETSPAVPPRTVASSSGGKAMGLAPALIPRDLRGIEGLPPRALGCSAWDAGGREVRGCPSPRHTRAPCGTDMAMLLTRALIAPATFSGWSVSSQIAFTWTSSFSPGRPGPDSCGKGRRVLCLHGSGRSGGRAAAESGGDKGIFGAGAVQRDGVQEARF